MVAISRYVKGVAAAVATFAALIGEVLVDDAVSFDELSALKSAAIAVGAAVVVVLAPANSD